MWPEPETRRQRRAGDGGWRRGPGVAAQAGSSDAPTAVGVPRGPVRGSGRVHVLGFDTPLWLPCEHTAGKSTGFLLPHAQRLKAMQIYYLTVLEVRSPEIGGPARPHSFWKLQGDSVLLPFRFLEAPAFAGSWLPHPAASATEVASPLTLTSCLS